MSREDLIAALEEEKEMIRDRAERRMGVLQTAIDLLGDSDEAEGQAPARPAGKSSVSIADRVLAMAGNLPPGTVFTAGNLREMAHKELDGDTDELTKFERGLYAAFSSLTGRKLLLKVEGGYKLANEPQG